MGIREIAMSPDSGKEPERDARPGEKPARGPGVAEHRARRRNGAPVPCRNAYPAESACRQAR